MAHSPSNPAPTPPPVPPAAAPNPSAAPTSPTTPTAPAAVQMAPIVYDLPTTATATASATVSALVAETQRKFDARAARFGTVPHARVASEVHVLGARRAAPRTGFVTGFDPGSAEEAQRRARRSARFACPGGATEDAASVAEAAAPAAPVKAAAAAPPVVTPVYARCKPLERRREAVAGEAVRETVVCVFGVDELSTKQVLGHFREYGPSWCEWLNDSSCNVAFEDAFTARRVLRCMGGGAGMVGGLENGVGDGVPCPEESMDETTAEGRLVKGAVWRVGMPVKQRGVFVPIWIRQATEKDRRPEAPNPRSKWSRNVVAREDAGATSQVETSRRRSRRGRDLGLSAAQAAINKVRTKKISKMDLDKALSSS